MGQWLRTSQQLRAWIELLRPDCAVWDFDGVMVDSEPLQAESSYRIMLQERGNTVPPDFFHTYLGQPEAQIWELLCRRFQVEGDPSRLRAERQRLLLPRLLQQPPSWFVPELLAALGDSECRCCIVSSGEPETITGYLEQWDLTGSFDRVSAAQPGCDPKAQRLQAALGGARQAVVLEDLPEYLQLAARLGAHTLGVAHRFNRTPLPADVWVRAAQPG